MPGTGPLRRSRATARNRTIVGKSRVERERASAPSVCLSGFGHWLGFLGGRLQVSQLSLSLLSKRFHVQVTMGLKPISCISTARAPDEP
jgi:hypothetical protein